MSTSEQRLSPKEKIGYGLGDAATNFFFMSMLLYQGRYYTDVVGLSATAVGSMFFLVRWLDAITDPIIGALADRTQTKWGKFRPWVLWTAVPYALIFWLAYSTPNFSGNGKFIYCLITYMLLMVAYSANNTPYSALTGVMTSDPSERTSISTYRLFIAIMGQLMIQGLALPLVDKLGHGDAAKGWSLTIGCFSIVMVVFFIISFSTTRERVQPNPQQKTSFKRDLIDVFTCRPWVVMFLLTLFLFTTLAMRGGMLNYFFTYYLDPHALMTFVQKAGFGPAAAGSQSFTTKALDAFGLVLKPDGSNGSGVAFSLFNMASNLIQIPGILFSKMLSDRFGKRNVFLVFLTLTTIVTALPIALPPDAVGATFTCGMLWGLFWGPTVPLLWAMIADVPDYAEWKTTRRATGFAYAGIVFALKAGLGVGGALGNWFLAGYGYAANVAQTEHSLLGIRMSASVFSALPFFIGMIILFFYPITKELAKRIEAELSERRKKYAHA